MGVGRAVGCAVCSGVCVESGGVVGGDVSIGTVSSAPVAVALGSSVDVGESVGRAEDGEGNVNPTAGVGVSSIRMMPTLQAVSNRNKNPGQNLRIDPLPSSKPSNFPARSLGIASRTTVRRKTNYR
jgi:hypothetical protein